MTDDDEITGIACVAPGHRRRYRIGFENGEIFAEGDDYDGVTLVIEATSIEDAKFILGALSHGQNMPPATGDVLTERWRQWFYEGWSYSHDDAHSAGELPLAAACYALQAALDNVDPGARHDTIAHAIRELWPFAGEWWKPSTGRRDLVKAGALIIAEIERLDRATLGALDKEANQ